MKSAPYELTSGTTPKTWFNEVGGTGSVNMGKTTFSSDDSNNKDIGITMSSAGITELNNRLTASNYDFTLATQITKRETSTTSSAYTYCYDTRLILTFTYTKLNVEEPTVAVGDDLSGYAYSTSLYDIGRIYTSSSGRGYATWDISTLKAAVPAKSESSGKPLIPIAVSLRINQDYGYLNTLRINHMKTNPDGASASTIHSDAADGTMYAGPFTGSYVSTGQEFTWDLGNQAVADLQAAWAGEEDFFAVGLYQPSNYAYRYSPKLVITMGTEKITMQLGSDNPEYDGDAIGYTYKYRTSTPSIYSEPYAYPYKTSSYERHGWAVFDLQDLTLWKGVSVKKAKLIIHNYQMTYAKEFKFTVLKTTPYYGAGTTVRTNVHTESGPSGTQIGSFTNPSTSTDSTKKRLEVDLNSNAISAINTKLGSSPKYYTFGIGIYVDQLHSGRTYGYARWYDIRLEVSFESDSEPQETPKDSGMAFGDDWSGRMYRYRTSTPSYQPYGEMYTRKTTSSEYRGFANWDVWRIRDVFPQENFSKIEIQKVSVRFNHHRSSLSNVYVYPMKYDSSSTSVTPLNLFTDCGDGTAYTGPKSYSSTWRKEYEWDLGADAVKDFTAAWEDNNPTFFGLGFTTTSTSGYAYDYGMKLVIEWRVPPPVVEPHLTDET
ncbi:MAG: hypothetical protein ACYS30_23495, partial [Planctomycetota bacterium]